MNFEAIEFEHAQGVARLALNRPDKLNSFNNLMHEELRACLQGIGDNKSIRCLLITANGRGFCAGQDLGDHEITNNIEALDLGESIEKNYNPLIRKLQSLEIPVICAVHGVAAGAGANLALACDIVLAGRSASFIQSFSKIGLVPDCGGSWILPRLVGQARAMALAMLGEKISAEQAESWGMIWQCLEDDQLMPEAEFTGN